MHFEVTFLSMNVLKMVRMKAKCISIASNFIPLHALVSLTRIEAKYVYITSRLMSLTCIT